jgi:hypothetical protein
MEDKIKLETILTAITTGLMLMIAFLISLDIVDFYGDKETYAKVYDLNSNDNNWEWQYLRRWVYLGFFTVIGLMIATFRFIKKDNKTIRSISRLFLIFYVCLIIIKFYSWIRGGYDH